MAELLAWAIAILMLAASIVYATGLIRHGARTVRHAHEDDPFDPDAWMLTKRFTEHPDHLIAEWLKGWWR